MKDRVQKTEENQTVALPETKGSSKINKLIFSALRIIVTAVILTIILFTVKTPYMFQAPGSCEDTSEFVKVKGFKEINTHGKFFLTTVIYEPASLIFYLMGKFNPDTELVPRVEGEDKASDEQRNLFMKEQMNESKLKAKIAALRGLGYHVEMKKGPVQVLAVAPWSKAVGTLKVGDSILEMDGKPVSSEQKMIEQLKTLPPEKPVNLTIKRNTKNNSDSVEELKLSIPMTKRKEGWKIGINIISRILDVKLPLEVDIDSSNIIGSSAGLMFTLEIMKQISRIDLTGGNKIAGTGSIDENGVVSAIEGVRFKIIAAEKKKCKYFLCPKDNFIEAKASAKTIEVLSVNNLDDALKHLKEITPDANIEEFVAKNRGKQKENEEK